MRVHYERLLKIPENLPHEIWTGTTGAVWDTVLRTASLNNGAVVTARSHGSGWAYLNHKMRGFNELWGATYFATFNQNHADEMSETQRIWPHFDHDGCPKLFQRRHPLTSQKFNK